MIELIKDINRKVNGLVGGLAFSGLLLLLLGVLIASYELLARLFVASVVIVIAFSYILFAYRIWRLKDQVAKYFKLK